VDILMAKLKDLEQRKAQLIAHIGSQRSVSLTPGAEWLFVPSFGGFDFIVVMTQA